MATVTSSRELYQRQIATEAAELEQSPEEKWRSCLIYQAKGLSETEARNLQTGSSARRSGVGHAVREELDRPKETGGSAGRPRSHPSCSSRWGDLPGRAILFSQRLPHQRSLALSGLALATVGAATSLFTGRDLLFSATRQLASLCRGDRHLWHRPFGGRRDRLITEISCPVYRMSMRAALAGAERAFDSIAQGRALPSVPRLSMPRPSHRTVQCVSASSGVGKNIVGDRRGIALSHQSGPRAFRAGRSDHRVHWRSGHEWAAHARLAQEAGIDQVIIDAIRRGERRFSSSRGRCVFQFVHELVTERHVGDSTYAAIVSVLGEEQVVELANAVGYYVALAAMLNAFDVIRPKDWMIPGRGTSPELSRDAGEHDAQIDRHGAKPNERDEQSFAAREGKTFPSTAADSRRQDCPAPKHLTIAGDRPRRAIANGVGNISPRCHARNVDKIGDESAARSRKDNGTISSWPPR